MIKISEIFEERKWRKKYNSLKIVHEDTLEEMRAIVKYNEILRNEIKKLKKDRRELNGDSKQKLFNNKRPYGPDEHRKTGSTKGNGTSNNDCAE